MYFCLKVIVFFFKTLYDDFIQILFEREHRHVNGSTKEIYIHTCSCVTRKATTIEDSSSEQGICKSVTQEGGGASKVSEWQDIEMWSYMATSKATHKLWPIVVFARVEDRRSSAI